MQKIIKTSRVGVVSSSIEFLASQALRLTRWLSSPPARPAPEATARSPALARDGRPHRKAGDPIGSVHFDGERLGGWPGEGRIR